MSKTKKHISREVGLQIGYICGSYFLKMDHLHYGYWNNGLKIDIANLPLAQEQYSEFVISQFPHDVKTILDVGCGTGQLAKHLIDTGYEVDCVCPDPFLREHARELLSDNSHIFDCGYEQVETMNRYDMVLFCESFQYIDPNQAFIKSEQFLRPGGYMLICDIFRKSHVSKHHISGGHDLTRFYDLLTKYPFEKITDIDITDQTAPNMDLMDDAMQKVVKPVTEAGLRFFQSRHPMVLKLIQWRYKKKFEKLERKYLSQHRTGENFKKDKSYRLMLCRKTIDSAE